MKETPTAPLDWLGRTILLATLDRDDDEGLDLLETLEGIRPLLNDRQWKELAMQFDVCPFHTRDIEICLDDDDDCGYLLELEFPDMDFGQKGQD